jgi:TPR repeat protein
MLLSLASPMASAYCLAANPAASEIVEHGLLDPSQPILWRRHLADALLCSALAGNAASQELAGTLYFQGRSRHGNVLPRDIARARRLLTAAANHGRQHAMHRLTELELGDGHTYDAALWARVERELHGPSKPAVDQLQRRALAAITPDSRLDTEVWLKLREIRETMASEVPPQP